MKSICPFQSYDPNSVHEYNRKPAIWEKRGNDECCSYCGSWHPRHFLEFLKEVIEDESVKVRIELNDKRQKIYITRPHVKNAKEGAIKIYLVHLKAYCNEMEFDISEIDRQLDKAFIISFEKSRKHADQIMESLINDKQSE